MGEIVKEKIEQYLAGICQSRDKRLLEMEEIADKSKFPIIGPEVGRLLYILAKALKARRVLELGSGYGYSAYWFALALPQDGVVHCTDVSGDNKIKALSLFELSGMGDKIKFHLVNALDFLDTVNGPFDIIFNDVDKEYYPQVIDKIYPLLKHNGLFITDNTLWHGKVAQKTGHDEATRAVIQFNQQLSEDERFDTVVVPIRDGLSICLKK